MNLLVCSVSEEQDRTSWSGIPFHLVQELRKLDDNLHYLALPEPPRSFVNKVSDKIRTTLTGKYRAWYWSQAARNSYTSRVTACVEEKHIDVILSTHTMLLHDAPSRPRKYVYTDATYEQLSDLYPFFSEQMDSKDIKSSISIERDISLQLDGIFVSSDWAKSGFIKYGVPGNKLHVVKFGANVELPDEQVIEQALARRLFEIQSEKKVKCIFIGKEWDRKRGDLAVDTVTNLRTLGYDATLDVFGSKVIERHATKDYITFNGQTKTIKGINPLVQGLISASIHLFPSSADCTPLAIAEASSFALPTVATESGGLKAMLETEVNGRLMPNKANGSELAQQVIRILKDYEQYAKASYILAKRDFQWSKNSLEIYRNLNNDVLETRV